MSDRYDKIKRVYDLLEYYGDDYDDVIMRGGKRGKSISSKEWGFDDESNAKWIESALGALDDDFQGRLLNMPAGSCVISMPVFSSYENAEIICVDTKMSNMKAAVKRSKLMGCENVKFMQLDLEYLPFDDESFDMVLSLNGLPLLEKRDMVFDEIYRVLKKGGTFAGCMYVFGEDEVTDDYVKDEFIRSGRYIQPVETKESLRQKLWAKYEASAVTTVNSMAIIRCTK